METEGGGGWTLSLLSGLVIEGEILDWFWSVESGSRGARSFDSWMSDLLSFAVFIRICGRFGSAGLSKVTTPNSRAGSRPILNEGG